MDKQFPHAAQGAHEVSGQVALAYFNEIAAYFPALKSVTVFSSGAQCLLGTGTVGARVYVRNDWTSAAALLIFTSPAVGDIAGSVAKCLAEQAISGGGPGGPVFQPCADRYLYRNTTDGVEATYYVFAVGTQPVECSNLRQFHQQYAPVDF